MVRHGRSREGDGTGERRGDRDGVATVEAYEVEDGVVLHDAANPLAWVEATVAVSLREQA